MEGFVIEEELLRWFPKHKSIGSNNATPRRNSIVGLERSVDGKRDANDAKSRCLGEESEAGMSTGGIDGDGDVDSVGKSSGDAIGTPDMSEVMFV